MPEPGSVTRTADPPGGSSTRPESLLCIHGDRSFRVLVPATGELVIGRGPDAGCSIEDALISRAHAQLLMTSTGLRLSDLGSRHGTLLNGERIAEPRIVRSGDVIGVGSTVFVVRGGLGTPIRSVLELTGFAARLGEELARAVEYERECSLLYIRVTGDPATQSGIIAAQLRPLDTLAVVGPRHIGVIVPELDPDEALEVAHSLAAAGESAFAIGVATAPYDGIEADALLGAARRACELARDSPVVCAADTGTVLAVPPHSIILGDPAMAELYELARRVARSTIPVLIRGETGVGKELAAALVHASSPRAHRPFISVNCAAIPEGLAESELFGHAKGAFSGALATKTGLLEAADGGTLFLDEIGELAPVTQAKLLRVLENGELVRVGEVTPRKVDLRIVAATNRDLQQEIASGAFRSDLYFRLGAARLELPPLADRPRDLALLAPAILRAASARLGRSPLTLSCAAAIALFRYRWPGNVRELRHALEFAAAATPDSVRFVEPWRLPTTIMASLRREPDRPGVVWKGAEPVGAPVPPGVFRPIAEEVRELERARMIAALRQCGGVQNRAAELIEMPLRTFVTKLKRYAIASDD
jgi:DNA-binding NtrC family response regulator